MQVDVLNKIILPLSLFLMMYGIGLSLRLANFIDVIKAPKSILLGVIGQMVVLPAVAWLLAVVLGLPPELAVGLLIIALAPGGATSNLFTYLAKGDVSLSITLTAIVSVVTPFTIPVLIAFAMQAFMGEQSAIQLPVGKTVVQLLVISVLPVALGMLTRAWRETLAAKIERGIRVFSIVFLFLIIALIVVKNSDSMLAFFAQAGLATLLLNVMVLFVGYQLGQRFRLPRAQSIALGFEVGIQNGTLALVVAGTLIGNANMMIPAVTYSLLMFVSAALFWRWVRVGSG